MTNLWAKPCLDSDPVLDISHDWVTRKANKRRSGVIAMDWIDLVDTIAREKAIPEREVSDALTSLLDLQWMKKVDQGFRVLVPKNLTELAGTPGFAGPQRSILGAERLEYGAVSAIAVPSEARDGESAPPVKQESVSSEIYPPKPKNPRSRVVVLSREIFPSLCAGAGIKLDRNVFKWSRLAQGIGDWQKRYEHDLRFLRQMMVEFASHPEWCQVSPLSPEQLFLRRHQKLTDLVFARQKADPGSRRFSDGGGTEYWLGTPTGQTREARGREYWLGKYA